MFIKLSLSVSSYLTAELTTRACMQVLEEACRKQKLDPSMHTLKLVCVMCVCVLVCVTVCDVFCFVFRHGGKAVDLNAIFRYTNIPKNAHLEMMFANRSQGGFSV